LKYWLGLKGDPLRAVGSRGRPDWPDCGFWHKMGFCVFCLSFFYMFLSKEVEEV